MYQQTDLQISSIVCPTPTKKICYGLTHGLLMTHMDEDPPYLRAVSLHLSRVLDEIGLNKQVVRRRRRTCLFNEQLVTGYSRLIKRNAYYYHFGSQTEGATTYGLDSDIDILVCLPIYNVIEDWSDWQQGRKSLMMLQDRTTPGYCRLQLLRDDVPMTDDALPDNDFTLDSDGRVIPENTWLNTPEPWEVRHGPACSQPGDYDYYDKDVVRALHCKSWPIQAEEFISRHRRHGWPSQNLIQEAVKHGVFLVPVGHKLSPTEPLEWRISASRAERVLMFSLDIVHIKCYVVLKMLVKKFIEPRAGKCISSYHCKTAILYSVENTVTEFWRDENLVKCTTQCLTLLLTWVTDGFCPQYFIAKENLFAGKVTPQNRNLLQSILKDLIRSNGRALLHVRIDDIGRKLQDKLSTEPSVVAVRNSRETMQLMEECECNKNIDINFMMKNMIVADKNTELVPLIRSVYKNIVMCKDRIRHSDKHERQTTELYIENLSRWLGSLLASFSLSNEMRVPYVAIQLLRTGVEHDIASIVKLASVFYNNGDFRKAEQILGGVESHISWNTMHPSCGCYRKPSRSTQEFALTLHSLRGNKARGKVFAHCVRFSPQEIHCVPPALRYELFRSVGDDVQHRDPVEDDWMDLAAVDSLIFLYYLQYMTHRQLGNIDLQNQSLDNLECRLFEDEELGHLETGWNLMGQCQELEKNSEAAIACYRTSLENKPRNNAAKQLLGIL